jgi:probable addiction module antidote protein
MKNKSDDYKADLLNDLRDPNYAASYLSAAADESPETLLLALRDVVEAQQGMTKLASETGLNRVNLYRMLSEEGNPRLKSVYSVLPVLGFRIEFVPIASSVTTSSGPQQQTKFGASKINRLLGQMGSKVQKASISGFGTGKTGQLIAQLGSLRFEENISAGAEPPHDISKKLSGQERDENESFLPKSGGAIAVPTDQLYQ